MNEIVVKCFPKIEMLLEKMLETGNDALLHLNLALKTFYLANELYILPHFLNGTNIDVWFNLCIKILSTPLRKLILIYVLQQKKWQQRDRMKNWRKLQYGKSLKYAPE
jgi:hypothetical protein